MQSQERNTCGGCSWNTKSVGLTAPSNPNSRLVCHLLAGGNETGSIGRCSGLTITAQRYPQLLPAPILTNPEVFSTAITTSGEWGASPAERVACTSSSCLPFHCSLEPKKLVIWMLTPWTPIMYYNMKVLIMLRLNHDNDNKQLIYDCSLYPNGVHVRLDWSFTTFLYNTYFQTYIMNSNIYWVLAIMMCVISYEWADYNKNLSSLPHAA